MQKAKVILDSIHPRGVRATTIAGRVPTLGLAQLNTHGWFAKNAASARAIPTERMIASILEDPYIPTFGSNQRGMKAGPPVLDPRCNATWLEQLSDAVRACRQLAHLGVHKEDTNRLLAPWSWTKVVVTGHDAAWANFLALRNHDDAYPPLRDFARQCGAALLDSTPTPRSYGDWHLPYADPEGALPVTDRITQSVARCARVSYETYNDPGRNSTLDEDRTLFERLLYAAPMHASPAEHQLLARTGALPSEEAGRAAPWWFSYRKTLLNEVQTDLTYELQRLQSQLGNTTPSPPETT